MFLVKCLLAAERWARYGRKIPVKSSLYWLRVQHKEWRSSVFQWRGRNDFGFTRRPKQTKKGKTLPGISQKKHPSASRSYTNTCPCPSRGQHKQQGTFS